MDYNSGPYNVTFPAGSTNASFDIVINNDIVSEDNETFNISIIPITNGHIVGIPEVATVTIIDTTSKYFAHYQIYKIKVKTCLYVHTYICTYVHTYVCAYND